MAIRPLTDYKQFDNQFRQKERVLRHIATQYGTTLITLPYDVNTTNPDEIQENARILYNALNAVMGNPEMSKDEFNILVKQVRTEMGNNPNWLGSGF